MQSNVRSCHVNVERIPKTVLVAKRRDSQSDEQQLKSDQKIWFIVPVKEDAGPPPELRPECKSESVQESTAPPLDPNAKPSIPGETVKDSTASKEKGSTHPTPEMRMESLANAGEDKVPSDPAAPGMVSNVKPCYVSLQRFVKSGAPSTVLDANNVATADHSGEHKTWQVEQKRDGLVLHVKVNGEARPRFEVKEDGNRQWSLAAKPTPSVTSAAVVSGSPATPAAATLKSTIQSQKPLVAPVKSSAQLSNSSAPPVNLTSRVATPAVAITNSPVTASKSTVQCAKPTFKIFNPSVNASSPPVTAVKSTVQGLNPRIFKIFNPTNVGANSTVHAVKSTAQTAAAICKSLSSTAKTMSATDLSSYPLVTAVKSTVQAVNTIFKTLNSSTQAANPTAPIASQTVMTDKSSVPTAKPLSNLNIKSVNADVKSEMPVIASASPTATAVKSTITTLKSPAMTATFELKTVKGTGQSVPSLSVGSPLLNSSTVSSSVAATKSSAQGANLASPNEFIKSTFQIVNPVVKALNSSAHTASPSAHAIKSSVPVESPAIRTGDSPNSESPKLVGTGEKPAEHKATKHDDYRRRVRSRSDDKPYYKCEQCQKCFKRSRDLKHHTLTHLGKSSFECNVCHEMFTRLSNLHRHSQTHAVEKQYKCEPSGEAAASADTSEKSFMCDVCGMRFVHSHNLISHARTHVRDRSYVCDDCSEEFTSLKSLEIHARSHETGEHKCHLCDQVYSSRHKLSGHLRSHARARPYKCEYCTKAFLQRPHLVQHLRMHTGEKPYKCHICEKAFRQISNLNAHLLTHSCKKRRVKDPDRYETEFAAPAANHDDLSQSLPHSEQDQTVGRELDDSNFGFDEMPSADPNELSCIVLSNRKVYARLENLVERLPIGLDGHPLGGDWLTRGYAFLSRNVDPDSSDRTLGKDLWHMDCTYLHNWSEQPLQPIYVDADECGTPILENAGAGSPTPTYEIQSEGMTAGSESWPPVLHLVEPTPSECLESEFGRRRNEHGDCEMDFDDNELRQLLDEYPLCGNEFARLQKVNDDHPLHLSNSDTCADPFLNFHNQSRSSDVDAYGDEFRTFSESEVPGTAAGSSADHPDQSQSSETGPCAKKSAAFKVNGHSSSTNPKDKLYPCELCDKIFKRRQSLKEHIWTHTGQKPYKCEICEKRYTRSLELRNHIKSHTGEIPYKCHICDKFYQRRFDLKRHILTHAKKPV